MRSLKEILGWFFETVFSAILFIPMCILGVLLYPFGYLFTVLIAWLCEKRSNILILLTVIVSCSLLACLIFPWGNSRPVEEPRIESQSIGSDLSDSKTSSGGSNTGGGREFPPPENSDGYIGNTSTKKFHEPSCGYLPDAANRIFFDTRDEALDSGYSACRRCYP